MTADRDATRSDAADAPIVPGRKPRRRLWRWGLGGVAAVLFALVAYLVFALSQTLTLPAWLQQRVEARIERNLDGLDVSFGGLQLVINRGWRPRVSLKNMVVTTADGQPVLQLADAQASLAMRPLLRGLVQPKSIALSGVFATLRRDAEGNLSISFGANAAAINRGANLAEMIEALDDVFLSPGLAALVSVDVDGVTLQYQDSLKNRTWTLDDGRVQLERNQTSLRISSGFALLGGADVASSVEANYSSRFGTPEADFGIVWSDIPAPDIAAQTVALEWLDVLRAPISGAARGGVNPDGSFRQTSATLQIGAGALQPAAATRPIPFEGARSYVTYDPADQTLVFDEVSIASGWGSGSAEGQAFLDVSDGNLNALVGQFLLSDVSVNPDALYETPLTISRASADFRIEFAPFRITLGQMQLLPRNSVVSLSGQVAAKPDGWSVALDATADEVTPPDLMAMWPERAVRKPRAWVNKNLSAGLLSDINFALRIDPGRKPDIYLDFDYDDATITFLKTLPPITGASGQATFVGRRFVTTATAGEVLPEEGGPLDIAGTSFIIPDTDVKPATPAIVRLQATGSVTSVVSLLDRPPLSVLKDTPFPVALADGRVRASGTLALPMKPQVPFEDLEFHLSGTISDARSTVLVPGFTVTAPELAVRGNQYAVTIAGQGLIDALPVDMRWRQPLGPAVTEGSRVEGTVELSQRAIDTFNIGLPDGSVSGRGTGTFAVGLVPGAPPSLSLTSDLAGVRLALPPLGWSKSARQSGLLQVEGVLGDRARINRLILKGGGLSVSGNVVPQAGGGLERAVLDSVRIGDWLDASVELVGRASGPPDIRIRNGRLDLRRATFESGGGAGGASGDIEVSLDRLQVTDTITLTGFTGSFSPAGGMSGRFRGKVNGGTEVNGTLAPSNRRSSVRLRSDDAGGVVRDAGLLKQARGGSFDLTLMPVGSPGQFDGALRIERTQVQDAPAIAALVNAISGVGLLDELTGQGIQFSAVDARFRLGPAKVTVYESSATGPSIGLSMDGVFDVATGMLRMQGVISPVYLLNQIGNLISRRGEGVIGFNYTLTGPAQSPSVQVNPLSALTPGPLRDILRANPPPRDGNAPPPRRTPHMSPDDASSGR